MTRPWVKVLLIVSLALNLLVVGALAGVAWRGRPGSWQQAGGGSNLFGFVAQLPKERRDLLHKRAGELRPAIRDLRETVRSAARDRAAALAAEPFERQRYIDAQTRQIEADTRLRMLMRDAVAEIAAEMTPQERRAFLKWRGQRRILGPDDQSLDEPPAKRK